MTHFDQRMFSKLDQEFAPGKRNYGTHFSVHSGTKFRILMSQSSWKSTLSAIWCTLRVRCHASIHSDVQNNCLCLIPVFLIFSVVRKLENSVFKFYIINALVNNKTDKVNEFFSKMVHEIQGQIEWKEWYGKYQKIRYVRHFVKRWRYSIPPLSIALIFNCKIFG
jgi:hypothetical protein